MRRISGWWYFVVLLLIVIAYLGISNFSLRYSLESIKNNRNQDFNALLQKERQAIIKDVEEKYKADMVSFEVLAKRMQIEKQKNKELQDKLEKTKEK